jgi:type IV pilus assembly protein PilN
MIRINLMPEKRRAQPSEKGQLWLVAVLGLLALEMVGCFLLYSQKQHELMAQRSKNRQLEAEITQSKATVSNHQEVMNQLATLRAREEAIKELQKARSGPTAMLLEVAKLLTPGRGPSVAPERLSQIRRENPLALSNSSWDVRRLWLRKFVEQNRTVRLEGSARDGEDVSELARRMALSDYFYDVKLLPAKKTQDADTKLEIVAFQLEARVRY